MRRPAAAPPVDGSQRPGGVGTRAVRHGDADEVRASGVGQDPQWSVRRRLLCRGLRLDLDAGAAGVLAHLGVGDPAELRRERTLVAGRRLDAARDRAEAGPVERHGARASRRCGRGQGGRERVADVQVVVVVGHRERRAAEVISEISCDGSALPFSRMSSLIACSVSEPGPWWPTTGWPSKLAMSTAAPNEWALTLPLEVR